MSADEPDAWATIRQTRALLEEMLGVPFTDRNRVEVLRNGVRIFPRMLDAIASARRSIEFLTFVYWQGEIAVDMASALSERAGAGVRTRVLLDAVGARPMDPALLSRMRDAGVEVVWFRRPVPWKIWNADHRTHRKILVCDRGLGFTGGVGIAREWEGDARHPGEWRDTHLEIEGPAVRGLEAGFVDNWLEAERSGFPDDEPIAAAEPGHASVQVVRSGARVGWSDAATLVQCLLARARRRIRIATAYFVPERIAVEGLVAAARKGITVEVLVPGPHHDVRLSRLAGQDVYDELVRAGVGIWHYQPAMMHAKILTVDGMLAVVGSLNFNQRSMSKDDEIALTILDRDVVARLDADFDADLEVSERIELGRWRGRGLAPRAKEWATRLVRSEL